MNDILRQAIEHYGADAQKHQAIEELAELQVAISHDLRGRDSNISEEIADVEIMLEQLKFICGCGLEVTAVKEQKIARLARRMSNDATKADNVLVELETINGAITVPVEVKTLYEAKLRKYEDADEKLKCLLLNEAISEAMTAERINGGRI